MRWPQFFKIKQAMQPSSPAAEPMSVATRELISQVFKIEEPLIEAEAVIEEAAIEEPMVEVASLSPELSPAPAKVGDPTTHRQDF